MSDALPVAMTLFRASVTTASANEILRPRCTTRPLHVTLPESLVNARTKLTFRSTDVMRPPTGWWLRTESAVAVSMSVAA